MDKQQILANAIELMQSGTQPKELTVSMLTPLSTELVDAIRSKEEDKSRIYIPYIKNHAHYQKFETKRQVDTWGSEEHDHAILQTLRKWRERGNQKQYDAILATSKALNKAGQDGNKFILMTYGDEANGPAEWQLNGCSNEIHNLYVPRLGWSKDQIIIDGIAWHKCTTNWYSEVGEFVEYNGIPIAIKVGSYTKLLATPLQNDDGMYLYDDNWDKRLSQFADMLREIFGTSEGITYTESDVELYDYASSVIKMSTDAEAANSTEVKQLQSAIEGYSAKEEQIMGQLQTAIQNHNESKRKLNLYLQEGSGVSFIKDIFGQLEKVKTLYPVKSANLTMDKKKSFIEVELWPLVADCQEKKIHDALVNSGQDRTVLERGRGKPSYRLLDKLKFRINVVSPDKDTNSLITWIIPEGVRIHPHIHDGRPCYGDAAASIAAALANRNYDEAIEWLFAWCGGIADHEDHLTKSWEFPAAPEGSEPGWLVEENIQEVEHEAMAMA